MFNFLLVDDEPIVREGMRLFLRQSGLPVGDIIEANNGEEAITILKRQEFSILISDIKMPKMDGLELSRRAKELNPNMALVIVSGYEDFKYAQTALRYGVKDYLLKPLSDRSFISVISSCIDAFNNKDYQSYSIPLEKVDSIIYTLESQIWEDSINEIENTCKIFETICVDISLDFCKKTAYEILEIVISKLSSRIGYHLIINISKCSSTSKLSFHRWFVDEIKRMKEAVRVRKASVDFQLMDLAKQYIEENYNSDISLNDVSRKVGLNPSYFSRIFKSTTGTNFVDYRTEIRINKAKELLKLPNKSLIEITYDIGFSDTTHFIRLFKKLTGITPNDYRQKV
jgi:Response regulator containing CheY-like receiver domain and AraC-type DNA-binding domain